MTAQPSARAESKRKSSLTTEYLAHLADIVRTMEAGALGATSLRSAAKIENLLLANSMVKLLRAYGGCLGAERR